MKLFVFGCPVDYRFLRNVLYSVTAQVDTGTVLTRAGWRENVNLDDLVAKWAFGNRWTVQRFFLDIPKHGDAASAIRDAHILTRATQAVAIINGDDPHTWRLIELVQSRKIPILIEPYAGNP